MLTLDERCLYALADAVRSASFIDVFRWRYVLSRTLERGALEGPVRDLLRQTGAVADAMAELSEPAIVDAERTALGWW